MPSGTVTTRGRITVPIEVRESLGLRAGSRVAFVPTDDGGYVLRAAERSVCDLHSTLQPCTDGRPCSIEEMDAAIAADGTDE